MLHFWNLVEIFNVSNKKMTLITFVFPKLRTPKTLLDKCQKSFVSEDASTSNIVNVLKHSWNLHHSTFIKFIDHCQSNWVAKSLSEWHAKSWDFFLTRWLPITSILFLIETIWRCQFWCNYLRTKNVFFSFLLHFWNLY